MCSLLEFGSADKFADRIFDSCCVYQVFGKVDLNISCFQTDILVLDIAFLVKKYLLSLDFKADGILGSVVDLCFHPVLFLRFLQQGFGTERINAGRIVEQGIGVD